MPRSCRQPQRLACGRATDEEAEAEAEDEDEDTAEDEDKGKLSSTSAAVPELHAIISDTLPQPPT